MSTARCDACTEVYCVMGTRQAVLQLPGQRVRAKRGGRRRRSGDESTTTTSKKSPLAKVGSTSDKARSGRRGVRGCELAYRSLYVSGVCVGAVRRSSNGQVMSNERLAQRKLREALLEIQQRLTSGWDERAEIGRTKWTGGKLSGVRSLWNKPVELSESGFG